MFKSGVYMIFNVEEPGRPLYYDEQQKRLKVAQPGQSPTKFYLDLVRLEESAWTIQYVKQGTYAHVPLTPGNEVTEVYTGMERAACYPFVEVDDVDPFIWKLTLINNSVIFRIEVYAGGYRGSVWTTSESGVVVAPVDEEQEDQQHFLVVRA